MTRWKLTAMLERDEALVLRMYKDSRGVQTIGYGHNLDARPITRLVADVLLRADITATEDELAYALPWASSLSSARYGVLLAMAFNLGVSGLMKFEKFLLHAHDREWADAAREILDSDAARQTGRRYQRLSEQFLSDTWQ